MPLKSPNDFDSIIDLLTYFKDEETCLAYLKETRWNGNPRCPHCGFNKIYCYKDGKRYKCASCKEKFTVKIGTVFEHSPIPLQKWFTAMYLIGNNKKGIPATQLAKQIKVTRRTAWFMAHRIRQQMNQKGVQLEGVVESDETFVGGKNSNRHVDKKYDFSNRSTREFPDKSTVLGMIEQGGLAKTQVIPAPKYSFIHPIIRETIKAGSTWVTDNFISDKIMNDEYEREVVNHHQYKYLSNNGHTTNNIEGFWSHLKRTIFGVFHNVSRKHLQRYCDEITFRFNTRNLSNGERLALMFSKVNCRITYKQLVR